MRARPCTAASVTSALVKLIRKSSVPAPLTEPIGSAVVPLPRETVPPEDTDKAPATTEAVPVRAMSRASLAVLSVVRNSSEPPV